MLNAFETAYIAAMLWSTNDESDDLGGEGEPLDANYSIEDLSSEAIEMVHADCAKFRKIGQAFLAFAGNDAQNGHDFWLTRNGHGVGFFDRGYSKTVGDKLSSICSEFGEQWPYVGDDGKIYL